MVGNLAATEPDISMKTSNIIGLAGLLTVMLLSLFLDYSLVKSTEASVINSCLTKVKYDKSGSLYCTESESSNN